jgi:uncharacterized membrane protein
MAENSDRGVRSHATINGHPIHPMLVPFPIAFLVGTLGSDIGFMWTADPFWARASMWLIGAALVMGALAAVVGMVDFTKIKEARGNVGWTHVLGNVTVVVLSAVSLIMRLGQDVPTVTNIEIGISTVVVGLLLITGWMGGELVFRYKIGQISDTSTPSATAQTGRSYDHRTGHPAE